MRTHTLLNRPVRWRSRGSFWLGWRSRRISVLMPAAQARQSAAQPPRPAVISTSPTEDEVRVISRAAPPPPSFTTISFRDLSGVHPTHCFYFSEFHALAVCHFSEVECKEAATSSSFFLADNDSLKGLELHFHLL